MRSSQAICMRGGFNVLDARCPSVQPTEATASGHDCCDRPCNWFYVLGGPAVKLTSDARGCAVHVIAAAGSQTGTPALHLRRKRAGGGHLPVEISARMRNRDTIIRWRRVAGRHGACYSTSATPSRRFTVRFESVPHRFNPRTPRTSHAPIKEPPPEPDDAPGPVDPDSPDADDSVESPEAPRKPVKRPL
jgi:hypothetical protein